MYIRRTTIKSRKDGTKYYTYRLVTSERTKGVRQHTLLNLGAGFSLPREQWPELATRIQEILDGQQSLFEAPQKLEELAQNYAAQLIQVKEKTSEPMTPDYREVDVDSMKVIRPRSVSCEHVAIEAFNALGFGEYLKTLGFN
ncbi:MAG: transposase, partial [Deltaproteobacteria bacterium]